jgi:hypothetical protein
VSDYAATPEDPKQSRIEAGRVVAAEDAALVGPILRAQARLLTRVRETTAVLSDVESERAALRRQVAELGAAAAREAGWLEDELLKSHARVAELEALLDVLNDALPNVWDEGFEYVGPLPAVNPYRKVASNE